MSKPTAADRIKRQVPPKFHFLFESTIFDIDSLTDELRTERLVNQPFNR